MFDDDKLQAAIDQIQLEESRGFGLLGRKVTRIIVRTLRAIAGLCFVSLAIGIWSSAMDRLSTPFAAQSFAGLVVGLSLAAIAFMFLKWAFGAAFGAGPSDHEERERLKAKALERLQNSSEPAKQEPSFREADDETVSYHLGKYIGSISKHKPPSK